MVLTAIRRADGRRYALDAIAWEAGTVSAPITFKHGGKTWLAYRIANSRGPIALRIVLADRSVPEPAEVKAARRCFLDAHSAPDRPQRSGLRLVPSS